VSISRLAKFGALLLAWGALAPFVFAAPPPEGEPVAKKPAEAAKEKSGSKFLRLRREDDGKLRSMETAMVRYVTPAGVAPALAVDLIGAVHVGEKSYYERLNGLFASYDALLYELVAPEGTRIPKGGRASTHPVGMLQQGMKDMLELEYQLEHVDYEQDNFVHADMSPEDFSRSMEARGESFLSMMFRMMGQSMAMQSKRQQPGDVEMLFALFDPNRALALKRVMAEQFEDLEGVMAAFEGPDGSTIISERNKKALDVLKQEISDGKQRIGIFYGAGHMPDMEQRLISDFGLQRQSERWFEAWDLRDPKPAARGSKPAKKQKAR
jgi:hypothetical protein